MTKAAFVRCVMLLASVCLTAAGTYLFFRFTGLGGLTTLDIVRGCLVAISGFWLIWGGAAAILGVFVPRRKAPAQVPDSASVTAILVPIYNEDPVATFARIAAMNQRLIEVADPSKFHFFVLSDTQSAENAAAELRWFGRLMQEPKSGGRLFYRRREKNVGRKAGNIEDFIERSGGAYDYALILDADSLMEAQTIVEMVRQMDADPRLGLLQTVPNIVAARTLFGRVMQFSAAYMSPTFARGASLMQGKEGPYWGHNAIVRVRAFAASCGLPVLSGSPPFGGHILSHDYVEAALLSRAGWTVKCDPSLMGSFEEGPENLIEYAKRDRRWCQGNLQHSRLLLAPGLKIWSRFTFIQGIMAYAASPVWLALLAASIWAAIFPDKAPLLRGFDPTPVPVWVLGLGVALVLVLPKVLIWLRSIFDGRNRSFGGSVRTLLSVFGEIIISTLLAPTMLLLQTRSVSQVLLGIDGGWPATKRGQNWVGFADAWRASWWIVALAGFALASAYFFAKDIVIWLAPAMVPAMLAPVIISLSSRPAREGRLPWLFRTDSEIAVPPVVAAQRSIEARWDGRDVAQGDVPLANELHNAVA
jgi:membrane glycosyltransferase